jgi:chemotaxis protein methyltransferase WspC
MLAKAENLANAGKLTEAAGLCREVIAQHGATAPALFLLGMVNDAQGNTSEAITWFRKALYVEPGHEQALLHLSIIARQSGGSERATHLDRRARRAGNDTSGEDSA